MLNSGLTYLWAAIILGVLSLAIAFATSLSERWGFWASWACALAAMLLMILSVKVTG